MEFGICTHCHKPLIRWPEETETWFHYPNHNKFCEVKTAEPMIDHPMTFEEMQAYMERTS